MQYRHPIIVTFLIFLAGCATAPSPAPAVDDTSFFLGRYDKVWDATLKVLEKKSLSIKDINKETGEIVTRFANYSVGPRAHHDLENIAEKPDLRLGLYTQVGYSYTIRITPINDMSTQVKVTANIEAYDKNATQKWHKCKSNNVLERELLDRIKASL